MASKKKKKAAVKKSSAKRGSPRKGAGQAKTAPKKKTATKAKGAQKRGPAQKKKKTVQKGSAKGSTAAKAAKAAKSSKPSKASAPSKQSSSGKKQAKAQPSSKAAGKTKGTAAPKKAKAPAPAAAPKTAKVKFSAPRAPKSTIRTPEGAEELKQKLGALASSVSQIRSLKRTMNKSFYDIGQILREIRDERLYEVKGYGSFEAFVEREIDLGKQLSLKIVQIVQTFLKEAALAAGLERVSAALDTLEGEEEPSSSPQGGNPSSTASGTRSPIPLHKQ